jgi:hypothetical protein
MLPGHRQTRPPSSQMTVYRQKRRIGNLGLVTCIELEWSELCGCMYGIVVCEL